VSAQQFRPEGRPQREPVAEVPFFAPPRGDFPVGGGSGSGGGFGGGVPAPVPDARFGGAPASAGYAERPGRPGYSGHPGYAAPAPEGRVPGLEDVAGLGRAAVVLATVVAAADLVSALTGLAAGNSLVAALATGATSLVSVAALLANLVVVALWLRRARRNAERIDPRSPQRRAAVWAWFGWFVPLACAFVPFHYVSDVWEASKGRAPRGTSPRLRLWWTAWLLSLGLGNLSLRSSEQGTGTAAAGIAVVAALASVAALPLFRGVVRAVGAAQRP
jgi:hypothetical protein